MATAGWHELGAADGRCTVCGTDGALTLGEARFRRSLLERLRGEPCAPPARFVTCRGCGWRWSVRAADRSSDGAARRRVPGQVPAPCSASEPAVPTRTVLPHQRPGRDWAHPRR